jgi:paraquat-inducible protein A
MVLLHTPGALARTVACPDCDALQTIDSARAVCFRCGGALGRSAAGGERSLALAPAALPMFAIAQALPLLRMHQGGAVVETTALGGALALLEQRLPALAVLVVLTTIVLPALQLATLGYLLLAAHGWRAPGLGLVLRARAAMGPWAQLEILVLGALVAFGKLSSVFPTGLGPGLLGLVVFLVLERCASAAFDHRALWPGRAGDARTRQPRAA